MLMTHTRFIDMANKIDALPNNVKFIIAGAMTVFFIASFFITRHLESVIEDELSSEY